ncbi:MAG: transglutaminase domain-containing protein [Candidatus Brocadiia bacterium]
MRKVINYIVVICAICVLWSGCGSGNVKVSVAKPVTAAVVVPSGWQELVPAEYHQQFEAALLLAGDNRETLIGVLKTIPPEQRPGAAFLISTMTYPDLVAISKDVLLEDITYAYKVKAQYPWMKNMPEDIFQHYVLPYRCAEEPISAYRKYFYGQLDPIIGQCKDMADVVHQVNLWLGAPKPDGRSRVRFVSTEERDQSPLSTLKSGYGRCEEMMIIYMSAARSVGIPCRSSWTPYWAICDNNHAWAEVWVDGNWKPIGGCEPGTPWFEHPAKRAAAVYSVKIGPPAQSDLLHKSFGGGCMINSTPNYSKTCTVNVTVSADSKPVSGVTAAFAVFNWGSFRPVGTKITDKDGKASFIVGIGEYFLSAGNDTGRAWQVVRTEPDKTLELKLELEPNAAPDGYVFLRYPTAEEARVSFTASNLAPTVTTPLTPTRPAPMEIHYFEEFSLARHSDVMALLEGAPEKDTVVQKLVSAGGNWPEIVNAIKECKPELKSDLFWLIGRLAHLEAIEVTKEFLLDNVNCAANARPMAVIKVPDDIYRAYVLSPSFQYLHITNWRKELRTKFTLTKSEWKDYSVAMTSVPILADSITTTANAVNEWVQNNIKVKSELSGRFSYTPSPLDTFRSKVGDPYGVAVFTAGLLRTLGVPAQVKNDWVEFWDGANWLPLYPHDLKNFANTQRNEATASEYDVKPAGLRMNLFRKGAPDTNPWEKIAISRFQNGYWGYLEWRELKHSGKWVGIPPGTYLITAGVRNSNGDAMVYCKQLEFKSGEGVVLDIPLDIPLDKLPESDRVVRKLDKVPMFELPDLEGKMYNLTETLKTKGVILAFFSLDNEPSIRMLPLIDDITDYIGRTAGQSVTNIFEIVGIYVDPEGKDKLVTDGRLKSLRMPILLDTKQAVVKQFIPDFDKNKSQYLPSTLLISPTTLYAEGNEQSKIEPKILVWEEGYNMAIQNTIGNAVRILLLSIHRMPDSWSRRSERPVEPKITVQPLNIGPDYAGEADKLYKAGDYQKSLELYTKALEYNPDDAGLWYNIACDCALLGKVDDGINALKKALEYGYSELHWMDNDPDLATLRKDPRYKDLRK